MASNRHLGRIIALQTLYEYGFRRDSADATADINEVLGRNLERYQETIDDKAFVEELVHGVDEKSDELDSQIQPIAPEWPPPGPSRDRPARSR